MRMQAPDSKPKDKAAAVPALPADIPEDVRAELDSQSLPASTAKPTAAPAVPIPEDVLAEQDAAVRAAQAARIDSDLRPVDDDSEY